MINIILAFLEFLNQFNNDPNLNYRHTNNTLLNIRYHTMQLLSDYFDY